LTTASATATATATERQETSTDDIYSSSSLSFESYLSTKIADNILLLQGLRGLVAFIVLYEHFRPPGDVFFPEGLLADANVFVVISGFVTALQLVEASSWDTGSHNSSSSAQQDTATLSLTDTLNWKKFLFTRAVGIYPILWLTLVMASPRWYLQNNFSVFDPVASIGDGCHEQFLITFEYESEG
jgi:hypothetical protein